MRSACRAVEEKGSRERCRMWTVLHAQCTTVLSSGFPISQGNAEALERWGGKTKHRLISYFLSNTSAKNYRNRVVCVKIIASQRWDVFWDTVYMSLDTSRPIHVCYACCIVTDKCAGRLVLGSFMFARGKELEHWNQAVASPREPIFQWHPLA